MLNSHLPSKDCVCRYHRNASNSQSTSIEDTNSFSEDLRFQLNMHKPHDEINNTNLKMCNPECISSKSDEIQSAGVEAVCIEWDNVIDSTKSVSDVVQLESKQIFYD